MSLMQFLTRQHIEAIQWDEHSDNVLASRYPTQDMEIHNGGQLTVRETQMAALVDEGRVAEVFAPGIHTLNTRNVPVLTGLLQRARGLESPLKSEVYFFSTRLQLDQKWNTATPIAIRDKEFGDVRVRCNGIYSYRIADPRTFFTQIIGSRDTCFVSDLEDQLRNIITARLAEIFATTEISLLDITANHAALSEEISTQMKPTFAALGLELNQFAVENISLPEELPKPADQDIGAGIGVGAALTQSMPHRYSNFSDNGGFPTAQEPRFCPHCGEPVSQSAGFCSLCGKRQ